jgi:hypothetical protein
MTTRLVVYIQYFFKEIKSSRLLLESIELREYMKQANEAFD